MSKINFSYKTFITGALFTFLATTLNASMPTGCFFALPLLIATCYVLKKAPYYSTLFVISFILSKNFAYVIPAIISAVFLSVIFLIYSFKNKAVGGEVTIYSILACLPFILILNFSIYKIIEGVIATLLCIVFIPAVEIIFNEKSNLYSDVKNYVCLSILAFICELGFIRLFSVNALRSVVITAIFYFSYLRKNAVNSVAVAIILGVAPSVFAGNFTYVATFSITALVITPFIKTSKLLSSLVALLVDVAFLILFKAYGEYLLTDVFYSIIPVTIFLFTPKTFLNSISKKINAGSEKVLTRYAVNRLRNSISSKLYGVSDVFNEMQLSFTKLKDAVIGQDDLLYKIADEIVISVCENCPSRSRCLSRDLPDRNELIKILSVGVAKSKVSLIDLTKSFTENCGYTNCVIFEMNALITKYKEKIKQLDDLSNGKELIKLQAEGVAKILKNMALETSKTLTYNTAIEKKLFTALRKSGTDVTEILVYDTNLGEELDFVIPRTALDDGVFLTAVSEVLGKQMAITSKVSVSDTLCAVTLKCAPDVDASFGLARAIKDGSKKSGDTHSLVKISENKFLIALSDGMGSGVKAENTSATAISLIESFYKAGLSSDLILSMVNKILTLNTDDNFSATDILTVDLTNLSADFIKIGAPQSYVLTNDSIKLIEGSSLPLGILDDFIPTGLKTDLPLGSTVIMITDGISDAFTSSTDLISFLKTLKSKNPQTIADAILEKAVSLTGGNSKDDMTVLSIRLFSKNTQVA